MISTIFDILIVTILLLMYGAVCVFLLAILFKGGFIINAKEIKLKDFISKEFWSSTWSVLLVIAMVIGIVLLFKTMIPRYRVYFNRIEGYSNGKELLPEYDEDVYICNGSGSAHYHYIKSCSGLSSCTGMTVKMETWDAKREGYSPCTICFMTDEKYYIK